MYDYTGEPRAKVESVDHDIHIMGVKLGYFPYLLWGFLIGLFTGGPLVGFLLIGVAVVVLVFCEHPAKSEATQTSAKTYVDFIIVFNRVVWSKSSVQPVFSAANIPESGRGKRKSPSPGWRWASECRLAAKNY